MDNDPLFIGIYPAGIVYADCRREEHGDYRRVGFLSYRTLKLDLVKDCPVELTRRIKRHAAGVQARKGEKFQTSASGQYVILGE